MVEAEPEEPEVAVEPWTEPLTIEALLDQYVVESKFAGRTTGTTLFLTRSMNRSGEVTQCVDGQRWKLFLVS